MAQHALLGRGASIVQAPPETPCFYGLWLHSNPGSSFLSGLVFLFASLTWRADSEPSTTANGSLAIKGRSASRGESLSLITVDFRVPQRKLFLSTPAQMLMERCSEEERGGGGVYALRRAVTVSSARVERRKLYPVGSPVKVWVTENPPQTSVCSEGVVLGLAATDWGEATWLTGRVTEGNRGLTKTGGGERPSCDGRLRYFSHCRCLRKSLRRGKANHMIGHMTKPPSTPLCHSSNQRITI